MTTRGAQSAIDLAALIQEENDRLQSVVARQEHMIDRLRASLLHALRAMEGACDRVTIAQVMERFDAAVKALSEGAP